MAPALGKVGDAMRKLVLIAALAALPAWAQDKPATPASSTKPEAAKAEPAQPAKVQVTRTARKVNPKRSEDARHCLEKSTNTEIIKCAEAYL